MTATFKEEVYFRVNATKFSIHIRNKVMPCQMPMIHACMPNGAIQLVETAVRERFNDSAALVMRSILKATEATSNIQDTRSGE